MLKNLLTCLFAALFAMNTGLAQSNCSDYYACNFNPSSFDNTTDCVYPGCSDTNAINYDAFAGCDDGSCDYYVYGCNDYYACNYISTANINDGTCIYPGCTNVSATNYDAAAGCDDGSCDFYVYGCEDFYACNFNPAANMADGSCVYPGCIDETAANFNIAAQCDDGSCFYYVYGCVDFYACNFDSLSNLNDGSCIYPGCTDAQAVNYSPTAGCDDASCFYYIPGCIDFYACNFNPNANINDTTCNYPGCTSPAAVNYNANAGCNDGSCFYYIYGCTDFYACNFQSLANFDDGSCDYPGCTNSEALNYNESAGCDDGNCIFQGNSNDCYTSYVFGCTDGYACNYWSAANVNDGSCRYPGCTDALAQNYNSYAGCNNGSCTYFYYGCTDSYACNYTSSANFNDGSCAYPGCTDPDAQDYNSYAGCNNGSCTYFYYGCTDSYACNYSSSANFNDGSCTYPGCTDPEAQNYNSYAGCNNGSCTYFYYGCTDSYACNYSSSANFNDGSCTYAGCTDPAAQNYNSYAGCNNGSCTYFIYGCTDGYACNYTSSANFNDGTCTYAGCTDPEAQNYNSYAGCNNGSCTYFIYGCTDGYACNYTSSANFNDGSCTYSGCTNPEADNYNSYAGCDNGTCFSYVYGCTDGYACNYTTLANFNDGSCTYAGCTDPTALNYNAAAGCSNSGACIYQNCSGNCDYVYGCTDYYTPACNYNPQATFNDGSCTYPGCNDPAAVNFSAYAGCNNGTCTYLVFGCTDYYTPACNYNGNANVNDGSCEYAGCTDSLALNFNPLAGCDNSTCLYYRYGCTDYYTPACNYDGSANFNDGSCVYAGCTDSSALNFNALAGCDNGTCLYYIYGCTDYYTPACNYDATANFNDGSCTYAGCTDVEAYNYNPMAGCDNGTCQYYNYGCTDYYSPACNYDGLMNFNDGSCVYPGCNDSSALNYNPIAGCNNGTCLYYIYGCTDYYSPACNYNSNANFNDGSCTYPGCTDSSAVNYSPLAGCDNGTCTYYRFGCTDYYTPACNYDANANFNDGSCTYAGCTDVNAVNYNFLAGCSNTSCIYTSVNGCTIQSACNFSPCAITNDGSCTYAGCTSPAAINYNSSAACDDGSCIINGCTNSSACNYNPSATINNGSCVFPGCTIPTACNFDPNAGCSNGSCLFQACNDQSACNYQPGASCPGGICVYPGCTDASACNYSQSAGCEDGSCNYPQCGDENACNFSQQGLCFDNAYCDYPATYYNCNGQCLLDADADGICDQFELTGCIDTSACNFNPLASVSDNSCVYSGCTISSACNYQPSAGCDDGSCIYPSCGDTSACNYVTNALCYNNGYCDYPSLYYNCNGACLNDNDGDGVCNEFEIVGCTEPNACNYNPTAEFSNGSCTYPGCTTIGACNYDPAAGCSNDTCLYLDPCGICGGLCAVSTAPNGIISICEGGEIFIQANPSVAVFNYAWFNNGDLIQDGNLSYLLVNAPGNYYVVVSYDGQSQASDTVEILAGGVASIIVNTATALPACINSEVILSASTSGGTVQWSNGEFGNSIVVNSPGDYFATLTSNDGCQINSNTIDVTFNTPVNDFSASVNTLFLPDGEVSFSADVANPQGLLYEWNFGNQDFSLTPDPTVFYNEAGFYDVSLTVTDPTGCSASITKSDFIQVWNVFPSDDVALPDDFDISSSTWLSPYAGCVSLVNGNATGNNYGICITYNGGQSWTPSAINDTRPVYNVRQTGNASWISGGQGLLCVSYNGGQSWQPISLANDSSDFNALQFTPDGNTGWLAGSNGYICVYSNGNWTDFGGIPSNYSFNSIYGGSGWGYAVGSSGNGGGVICRYVNGNWVAAEGQFPVLNSTAFLNSQTGVAVGENSTILSTIDGGLNWNVLSSGIAPYQLNNIYLIDDLRWICVGDNGLVLTTDDGGQNFEIWNIGVTVNLSEANASDCKVYITGEGGRVFTYDTPFEIQPPIILQQGESQICPGQSATLYIANPKLDEVYVWSNGEIGNAITVSSPGEYTVYSDGYCGTSALSNPKVLTAGGNCPGALTCDIVASDYSLCVTGEIELSLNLLSSDSLEFPVNYLNGVMSGGDAVIIEYSAANGAENYSDTALGTNCTESWRPYGTFCDEGDGLNSPYVSIKSNNNSGATWSNIDTDGDGLNNGYGILVMDLQEVKSFNSLSAFQMFSDGKLTRLSMYAWPENSETVPSSSSTGWSTIFQMQGIGAGVASYDLDTVANPTIMEFANVNSRYVMFHAYNTGAYGDNNFIEIRALKLFNIQDSLPQITWSNGAENVTSISVTPIQTTTFNVEVTDGNQTCVSSVTIEVSGGGCTSPVACNYNANACFDDNTCIYPGCNNAAACNYNQQAGCNDGSCIFPGNFLTCNGTCVNDADSDGICDEYEVAGCTDILACNYLANDNDTTDDICVYPGCTVPTSCNYNSGAGCNNGSCITGGCNNPAADNYNPLAECNTVVCIISGCTDPLADNYNVTANSDNGSCYYSPSIFVYYDSIPDDGYDSAFERGLPNKPVRVTINPQTEYPRTIVVYTDGEGYLRYPFQATDELELKLLLQEEAWNGDTLTYSYSMSSGEDKRLAMNTLDSIVDFKPRIVNSLVSDIDSLKGYGGGMYVYNNKPYPVKAKLILNYDSLEWDEVFSGDIGTIETRSPDTVDTELRRLVWEDVDVPAGEMKLLSYRMTGDTVDGYNGAAGIYNFDYRLEMYDENGDSLLFTKDTTLVLKVRDAYQPNDITPDPLGYEEPHYIAAGDEIVYTIRFENTSDFDARRVVVSDTVDTYAVDFNTIRPLANSHRSIANAVIEKISESQSVISFDFKGINLSSSDTVDSYGKMGYAMFAVKTLDTLAAGTIIYNKATIMFEDSLGNQYFEEQTDSNYHTIYDCSMMQQIRQDTSYCEGYELLLETDTTFAYEWVWTDNGDTLSYDDSLYYNGTSGVHTILLMRSNPICTRYDSIVVNILALGCTNAEACNFDDGAQCDDGSCSDLVGAACDDGDTLTINDVIVDGCACLGISIGVEGCTDTLACNYNLQANISGICYYPVLYLNCDGSCENDSNNNGVCDEYEALGCADSLACNYNPGDTIMSDDICVYSGCTDFSACNYSDTVACSDGSCLYPGCNDIVACNFEITAGCNNNTCVYPGCTNPAACNYSAAAGCDDGSCNVIDAPCNDNNPNTVNDIITSNCICEGSLLIFGCTDSLACNYNMSADIDDGSCLDTVGAACDDGDTLTMNDAIMIGCECLGTLSVDYANTESFYVYPNPVSDLLNIYIGQPSKATLEIFNMQGDCVRRGHFESVLDVSNYSSGIYFLRLYRDGKMEMIRFEVVR